MDDAYLRYPDVRGDEVVFVADDDVWLADKAGGRAQRLTEDHAAVNNPRLSPDGRRIAWTSSRAGEPDVYVLDRDAGTVSRLTWWGRKTACLGWRDREHVLVASSWQEVSGGLTRLYVVGLDGSAEKLALGSAGAADFGPGGRLVLSTANIREPATWKRYRGGTASQLWIQQASGAWLRALADEPAGLATPVWCGDRVLFCSDLGAGRATITDPSAQAQLYSVDAAGTDLRQHTHHAPGQGYVRDVRTDGRTIVYHAHGRLFAMDGLDAAPRQIVVDLGIGAPAPLDVDPIDRLDPVLPDEHGTGSLVGWRGAVFYLTHRAGPARAISVADGVRVREPILLGKAGPHNAARCAYVSDAGNIDTIEVASLDGLTPPRRLDAGVLGYVLHLAASPDGTRIAVSSHDGTLRLVTVADGAVRELDRSQHGEIADLAWSPDSRYLVWATPLSGYNGRSQLRCLDATASDPWFRLTSGTFDDAEPVFTPDGAYLAWISRRTFDPRWGEFGFQMTFTDALRPWIAPLRADAPLPFGVSADGWPLRKPDDEDEDEDKPEPDAKAPKPVVIDADGFEARAVALPVPAGEYHTLRAVKDGLAWLREPAAGGQLGAAWAGVSGEEPSDVLERFSFETRKAETLVAAADAFEVSGDGEVLVVRHRDDVLAQPARRVEPDDEDGAVRVDLSRLRRRIDRRAQWRQMFDENGRLMDNQYWRDDMDGTDWAAALDRYRPLVDRCLTVSDVRDVLAEVVAELNTSHSYVMAPPSDPSRLATGYLGIDVCACDEGFRIDRVLPGDSSDPKAWAPLRRAGVDARAGDVIAAVDGRPCAGAPALGALLEGAAGKPVELVLHRDGQPPRRVGVVPLASEARLRYQAWVAARAARVQKLSDGRLGYLHVPDMQALGWAQLERMLDEACHHEGVIADLRYNGGGNTSQLVLERLMRRIAGWDFARYYAEPETYPAQAIRGPVVVVTNEQAGSDGDIGTAVARIHGLTVVGTRTWGGVIGIDGRFDLVDGTEVTQPRYASYLDGFGWGVENHGVDPTIEVPLAPDQWQPEDDVQLDAAIEQALRELAEHPAVVPPVYPPARF